jgi:hypothetical protein
MRRGEERQGVRGEGEGERKVTDGALKNRSAGVVSAASDAAPAALLAGSVIL